MRNRTKINGRQMLLPALLMMMLLAACGSGNANVTPTPGVDAIFTAAFQTLEAQQATQLALTPPTSTVTVTPFPTLPPPSPISTTGIKTPLPPGGGATACDNSAYVADVTIPDGTTLKAGEKFTKTWRIYNSGTCAWTTSYKLAYDSGEAMGGAATMLTAGVPSGQQVDISVALTAPSTNGTFRGNWRMQNASGVGFGNVVYVEIKVGTGTGSSVTPGGPTVTPGPSPTGSGMYNVSGNAGSNSVTIDCIGTLNKPDYQVTSSDNGNYTCVVPWNWEGEIRPSKGGSGNQWTFNPTSIFVPNVQANVGGLDFQATAP